MVVAVEVAAGGEETTEHQGRVRKVAVRVAEEMHDVALLEGVQMHLQTQREVPLLALPLLRQLLLAVVLLALRQRRTEDRNILGAAQQDSNCFLRIVTAFIALGDLQ